MAFFLSLNLSGSENLTRLKMGTIKKYIIVIKIKVCILPNLLANRFHLLMNPESFFIVLGFVLILLFHKGFEF